MTSERRNEDGYTFREIFRKELQQIELSRIARQQTDGDLPSATIASGLSEPAPLDGSADRQTQIEAVYELAHGAQLMGLAFSGGGIRSATFNLGVLQALAELKLLHLFDYLSTVSGGGYIGSWLTAWIRHRGFKAVQAGLCQQNLAVSKYEEEPAIGFLRRFSNYLTPKLGVFSADTWAFLATYLRNLSLNLTIFISLLMAVFLLPRLGTWGISHWLHLFSQSPDAVFAVTLVLLGVALFFVNLNLAYRPAKERSDPWYTCQGCILPVIVVPIVLAALLGSFWLWFFPVNYGNDLWILLFYTLLAGVVYVVASFLGWFVAGRAKGGKNRDTTLLQGNRMGESLGSIGEKIGRVWSSPWQEKAINICFILVSFAMVTLLLWGAASMLDRLDRAESSVWHVVTFGMPLLMLVFMGAVTLHIGLMGRSFPDQGREWWGRLGGWQFIIVIVWMSLLGIAIYGPAALIWLTKTGLAMLGTGWIVSSIAGVMAGKSPATGRQGSRPWLELVARVTPYIFVVGLLLSLSLLVFVIVGHLSGVDAEQWEFLWHGHASFLQLLSVNTTLLNETLQICLPLLFLALLAIALALSLRVDINQFSMHLLYRNRLVRCYLGASNPDRNPQPFTGFDPTDDLHLGGFAADCPQQDSETYQGPYPIVNAALNLVSGKELAWQQRKAASFVFTPRFCGYELPSTQNDSGHTGKMPGCFRPTAEYGGSDGGIQFGEAMAISGAAASPNMGYHSSPPLAFLLTIFNVRLGWWCGNTRNGKAWKKGTPTFGLWYLLKELFGLTGSESKYVYLSDGGHFENLGIYELVRRRCRLIVACDAGQDGDLTFEDLGNAIRKCYTDLGVEIEIDVSPIRLQGEKRHSVWHCAIGTIHYEKVDQHAAPGTLIYIKSSLTGQEPADILEYASHHPDFPHQTTADQWFDEAQFESYRKLGYHIATTAFSAAKTESEGAGDDLAAFKERLFTAQR